MLNDHDQAIRTSANIKFIGIWTFDVCSGRIFGDKLAGEYFGLTEYAFRKGVEPQRLHAAIDPGGLPAVRKAVSDAVAKGRPIDVVYHVTSPSLGRRKIRSVGSCYRENGEPIICSGYFIDLAAPHSHLTALEAINDLTSDAFAIAHQRNYKFLSHLLGMVRIETGTMLAKEYIRRFPMRADEQLATPRTSRFKKAPRVLDNVDF